MPVARERWAPAAAGVLLLLVYGATVAPTVTLWDAGEFIAAIETLGIPHPPGTPLYVLVARVWSDGLGFLPRALATNLMSVAATAGAVWLLARLLHRGTGRAGAAFAAAVCAGATATVWSNATETEVYAASLALSLCMLLAAERASRERDARWYVLTVYLFALSIPLHLSALVAAPGAIVLGSMDREGRWRPREAAMLFGAAMVAAGAGMVSVVIIAIGAVIVVASRMRPIPVLLALALGLSATLFLLVRSMHDPALDTGNPETWSAFLDVLARRQYAPAGLWPRQAPVWIQLANLFEYLDWQFAMGLHSDVAPHWSRTPLTVAFALFGIAGCLWHRRDDQRSWRAVLVTFLGATIGLVAWMNFKAGASFAWEFVPEPSRHEVRERDYFFALGFFCWGAWAGYGAVRLLASRGRAPLGIVVACVPLLLNWRFATRQREPDALLARTAALAWLAPLPERAVLVTGGDNDSFPLWYLQHVEDTRRDVDIITEPLLGAHWYQEEIARRIGLDATQLRSARTRADRIRLIEERLTPQGRPLVLSVAVDSAIRGAVSAGWSFDGLTYQPTREAGLALDAARAQRIVVQLPPVVTERRPLDTPDRAPRYIARVLRCTALISESAGVVVLDAASLDSTCNLR